MCPALAGGCLPTGPPGKSYPPSFNWRRRLSALQEISTKAFDGACFYKSWILRWSGFDRSYSHDIYWWIPLVTNCSGSDVLTSVSSLALNLVFRAASRKVPFGPRPSVFLLQCPSAYSFPSLYNDASKSVADLLLPIPTLVKMWLHPKDCLRPLWSTLLHSITFCTITPLIFFCGVSFSARLTYLTACLLPVCILEYDFF